MTIDEAVARIATLEAGIREHRDQQGDDRCWLDDDKLYALLPEGRGKANTALPPREVFLGNCARYCDSRQNPDDKYETLIERDKRKRREFYDHVVRRVELNGYRKADNVLRLMFSMLD